MQTLPNGIQKVESTDVVTVASINRNDDLLDAAIGVVNTATEAATPNTLVKRTSDGRIKAAPAVDDNDVVTKESVDQIIGEHNEVVTTINQGGNVLDVKVAAPLDITVYGDTAFNILGDMGAMNILNRWQTNGVVPIVDTARSNTGETSFKFSPTASSDSYVYQDMRYPLEKTKSYLVSAMVYIESRTAGDVTIGVYDSGSFTIRYSKNADVSKVGMWQYVALKIPKTNAITTPSSGFWWAA